VGTAFWNRLLEGR